MVQRRGRDEDNDGKGSICQSTDWTLHSRYGNQNQLNVLIVDPHGADADHFLSEFPDVTDHPLILGLGKVFDEFLRIERDVGATELCHATAKALVTRQPNLGVEVFSMNYPRAILDGGRLFSHLIRAWVPDSLRQKHHDDWFGIHRETLAKLDQRYSQLRQSGGLLLDLHTMAPYSPTHSDGTIKLMHAELGTLHRYVEDFINAPQTTLNRRDFDIITEDEHDKEIGCPQLSRHLIAELDELKTPWVFNQPYRAVSHFMMYHHLSHARGIACDLPKDLLVADQDQHKFHLAKCTVDPEKVERYASAIAKATIKTLATDPA